MPRLNVVVGSATPRATTIGRRLAVGGAHGCAFGGCSRKAGNIHLSRSIGFGGERASPLSNSSHIGRSPLQMPTTTPGLIPPSIRTTRMIRHREHCARQRFALIGGSLSLRYFDIGQGVTRFGCCPSPEPRKNWRDVFATPLTLIGTVRGYG